MGGKAIHAGGAVVKPKSKIIEGLEDALVYAKIDALWRRTKKKRSEEVSQYDWGYRDGVMAARSLFGTEHVVAVATPQKTRKRLGSNPLTGTWTKRDDNSGKFIDVKSDAKPFKGVRKKR